jgi:methyl-accepting chemotaxis protein
VNRNLLTRMGTASAVVAVLVAAVFIVLVLAVRDQQASSERAGRRRPDRGLRGRRRARDPPRRKPARRRPIDRRLLAQLRADPDLAGETPNVQAALSAVPGTGRAGRTRAIVRLEALTDDVRRAAGRRRSEADAAARRAVVVGFVGLAASGLLMALLAGYLRRAVVLPLRGVAHAARQMAAGDLSARVTEGGDAEPADLARSFNRMATSLQQAQDQLREENQATSAQARISRAVLDATPDPTGLFGPAGEVLLENAPMAALREELGELLTPAGENLDRERRDELVLGERTLLRYAAPVRDSTYARMGRLSSCAT